MQPNLFCRQPRRYSLDIRGRAGNRTKHVSLTPYHRSCTLESVTFITSVVATFQRACYCTLIAYYLTSIFCHPEQLSAALSQLGMLHDGKVITYCGGGIAATIDAFACKLLGQHDVAVYDGSMSEWVQSPDRALTLGNNP